MVETEVGLFKRSAFWENGRLPSSKTMCWFLGQLGFIGTQEEAEQRERGVSPVICLGERMSGGVVVSTEMEND